jgi:Skp family chaperone for outer membrane proteins
MKTNILDFEEVLKNFEPYHQSLKIIQKEKQEFAALIEEIKKEMEGIVNSSKSLILDEATQQKNQNRFRELQTKAVQAESEFRANIMTRQNDELEKNFKQILEIVNDWSDKNNIDLIVNKNSVVYVKPEFEITNTVIELIKDKGLHQEYVEGMYEVAAVN